jgi:hypothetical protein
VSEDEARRERELQRLLQAAAEAARPTMSDEEAEHVLGRVRERIREGAGGRRSARWPIGLGIAAAVLAAVVLPRTGRAPAPAHPTGTSERIARETVLRLETEGKIVFIRAVAYEEVEN